LERFNRVAVDREIRMIELKQEVNDLCRMAGRSPRYAENFDKESENADNEETHV
jgi:two-component system, chemotaxis family, CheB/CheR fusion protein